MAREHTIKVYAESLVLRHMFPFREMLPIKELRFISTVQWSFVCSTHCRSTQYLLFCDILYA
jgi:hypothetical protein